MHAFRALAITASFAMALGCSRNPPPEEAPPAAPPAQPVADLSRPCSVLTPDLAADITGTPFFRTLTANSISEGIVSCAQGLGVGGLFTVARMAVVLPEAAGPVDLKLAALCRGQALSALARRDPTGTSLSLEPIVPPDPSTQGAAEPPMEVLPAGACRVPRGGYAMVVADRVVEVAVFRSDGSIDKDSSRALADRLTQTTPQVTLEEPA